MSIALAGCCGALLALSVLVPGTAAASGTKVLPLGICLRKPVQGKVTCGPSLRSLPRGKAFYLLVSIAAQQGLGTYALDVLVERWQPKRRHWQTLRREMGVKIQPDWQYVWFPEKGLAAGRYRAFVATDFLAKEVDAPTYEFHGAFAVH